MAGTGEVPRRATLRCRGAPALPAAPAHAPAQVHVHPRGQVAGLTRATDELAASDEPLGAGNAELDALVAKASRSPDSLVDALAVELARSDQRFDGATARLCEQSSAMRLAQEREARSAAELRELHRALERARAELARAHRCPSRVRVDSAAELRKLHCAAGWAQAELKAARAEHAECMRLARGREASSAVEVRELHCALGRAYADLEKERASAGPPRAPSPSGRAALEDNQDTATRTSAAWAWYGANPTGRTSAMPRVETDRP